MFVSLIDVIERDGVFWFYNQIGMRQYALLKLPTRFTTEPIGWRLREWETIAQVIHEQLVQLL